MSYVCEIILGITTLIYMSLLTLLLFLIFFLIAVIKLIPIKTSRKFCTKILHSIQKFWSAANNKFFLKTRKLNWIVTGDTVISKDKSYLLIVNHQTWLDIICLECVFHNRLPVFKYFIKKELFWFPVLGFCWWALDMPFMQRHTKEVLEKAPYLVDQDFARVRNFCLKFNEMSLTIVSFIEGTRFTKEKHKNTKSPYQNLLRPKAGGIAQVLSCMGEQFEEILDITLFYPNENHSFWDFLCGRVDEVIVNIKKRSLTQDLIGDYKNDATFRANFQKWLNDIWREKDLLISKMRKI